MTKARLSSWAIVVLTTLLAMPALAGVASTPLQWSKESFQDNGQAVEHVTIRASNGAGQSTFIRFSLANAGFQRGKLEISFRQEAPGGTFYGKQTFNRGDYSVAADKLGLTAGANSLSSANGALTATLQLGGVKATVKLTSAMAPFSVSDKGGSGYIWRELMAPQGKLSVQCSDGGGRTFETSANAYAVHEASTATAHKVYDRSVQVFDLGSPHLVVDYIVLPGDRGGRALGFVVAVGKGKTFAGEVVKETRENEKVDSSMDYQVPYLVHVLAKRGAARAAIKLTGDKQVGREDDLADLSWAVRKAVGALMHPITYTVKGQAVAEVQVAPEDVAVVFEHGVRYKYAQTR